MWEAAKFGDDVSMMVRKFDGFRGAELLVETDRPLLIGKVLGMHEGKVEKGPELRVDLTVVTALDGTIGCKQRRRIGLGRGAIAAKHVPGKLVEQKDDGEGSFGGQLPLVEIASSGGLVGREEPIAAGLIEGVVL